MSSSVTVDFNAELARFTSAIDKATNDLNKFQSNASRVSANINSAFASLGMGLSVGGFAAMVKGTINAADELSKLSQKVGVSVESLSALQYAGNLADVSLESMGTGLKKLSVNMFDAAAGTGDAKDAFKALGINVKDAAGGLKSSDRVFAEIADKFAGMEDGAGKTALAVKILGRAGADMIPLLNGSSKGLAEMKDEAQKLGVIVGGDLARKSEEFNDNLTRINASLGATKIALTGGLIDGLNDFVAAQVEAIKITGSLSESLRLFVFNLDAMTSEKPGVELHRLNKELEEFRRLSTFEQQLKSPFGNLEADLEKKINFLKFLQRQEVAKLTGPQFLDARDLQLQQGGTKTKAPTLPGTEKAGKAIKASKPFDPEGDFAFAVEESLSKKSRAGFLERESEAAKKVTDEVARLNKMLEATPTAQLEKARSDMLLLAAALEKGTEAGGVSEQQFIEAAQALTGQTSKALDEMTEFAQQAAKNMQDSMADFFFDVMQGKFDTLGKGFKQMIDRMVANAAAAQLGQYLLGDFGKSGNLGGVVGKALGGGGGGFGDLLRGFLSPGYGDIAGLAAGVPRFAEGTDFVPRTGLALIHQGERIIPAAENRGGMSGLRVTNYFTINGSMDRRSQQQIAAEVSSSVNRAARRNS